MPLVTYNDILPKVSPNAFIAPNAWLTGDVEIESEASIFFGVVMRGDINPIRVGKGTNIQDHSMLHTSNGLGPCIVEDYVTVGHRALIHGCHVKRSALIGMGAVVLDNAVVGEEAMVGAQALVPANMQVPPRTLALGVPAKVIRELTDEEVAGLRTSAEHYIEVGANYRKSLKD